MSDDTMAQDGFEPRPETETAAAEVDPIEALVAAMHAQGRALSVATHFEIDDVIDPADSRKWITMAIMAHTPREIGSAKTVSFVDPW